MASRQHPTGTAGAVDRALRENDALVAAILRHHNAGRHAAAAHLLARLQQNLAYVASVADSHAPLATFHEIPNLTSSQTHDNPLYPHHQLQPQNLPLYHDTTEQPADSAHHSPHLDLSESRQTQLQSQFHSQSQLPLQNTLQSNVNQHQQHHYFHPLQSHHHSPAADITHRSSLFTAHRHPDAPIPQHQHLQPPTTFPHSIAPAPLYHPIEQQLPPLLAPRPGPAPLAPAPGLTPASELPQIPVPSARLAVSTPVHLPHLAALSRPTSMLPAMQDQVHSHGPARQHMQHLSSATQTQLQPSHQQPVKYWTPREHVLFEEGLQLYGSQGRDGKPDLTAIADHIGSRTPVQVRSHLQKHLKRLQKAGSSNLTGSGSADRPTVSASSSASSLAPSAGAMPVSTEIHSTESPNPPLTEPSSRNQFRSAQVQESRAKSFPQTSSSVPLSHVLSEHSQREKPKKAENQENQQELHDTQNTRSIFDNPFSTTLSRPLSSPPAPVTVVSSPSTSIPDISVPVRPSSMPHRPSRSISGRAAAAMDCEEPSREPTSHLSMPPLPPPLPQSHASSRTSSPHTSQSWKHFLCLNLI